MALLLYADNGAPWFSITSHELTGYSGNDYPICDDCMKCLIGCSDIVLIPVLNEAYCPKCGKAKLAQLVRYPEDTVTEQRRTRFYAEYFGIPQKGRQP